MNKKIISCAGLFLIFTLLFLTEFQKPTIIGKIKKVSGNYPIRISLENKSEEIILFDRELKFKEGSEVKIYGSIQNGGEIIANKITCLNC